MQDSNEMKYASDTILRTSASTPSAHPSKTKPFHISNGERRAQNISAFLYVDEEREPVFSFEPQPTVLLQESQSCFYIKVKVGRHLIVVLQKLFSIFWFGARGEGVEFRRERGFYIIFLRKNISQYSRCIEKDDRSVPKVWQKYRTLKDFDFKVLSFSMAECEWRNDNLVFKSRIKLIQIVVLAVTIAFRLIFAYIYCSLLKQGR